MDGENINRHQLFNDNKPSAIAKKSASTAERRSFYFDAETSLTYA